VPNCMFLGRLSEDENKRQTKALIKNSINMRVTSVIVRCSAGISALLFERFLARGRLFHDNVLHQAGSIS